MLSQYWLCFSCYKGYSVDNKHISTTTTTTTTTSVFIIIIILERIDQHFIFGLDKIKHLIIKFQVSLFLLWTMYLFDFNLSSASTR